MAGIIVLYRGIHGPVAHPEDFYSNERKGTPPRKIERNNPREYAAVSHWDTREALEEWARVYPTQIGDHVAEMHFPEDGPIECKQEHQEGHWNTWGEPEDFLPFVVDVQPVRTE